MEKKEISFTVKQKRKNSISRRLIRVIILLILPFNIVSVLVARTSVEAVKDQTLISLESLANLNLSQLDGRIQSINYYLYNLEANDTDFLRYSAQEDRDLSYFRAGTALGKNLQMNISTSASADIYFHYNEVFDESIIAMSGTLENDKIRYITAVKTAVMNWVLENKWHDYLRWTLAEIDGMWWMVRMCPGEGYYYGAMISLDELIYQMTKNSGFESTRVSITGLSEKKMDDQPEHLKRLSVSAGAQKCPLYLEISVPVSETYARLSYLHMVSIGLVLVYILLIPVLLVIFRHSLVVPLQNIRSTINLIKNGQNDQRITMKGDAEEFQEIAYTFNDMVDSLEHLKIEKYEMEISKRNVELQNLQLQIHPHFLMNIFNLLYSLAQIADYKSIQQLAMYLSNYFRHIFQNETGMVSLEEEMALIEEYVAISTIRYPGACELFCDLDPEILQESIPSLLIHNFVENVFKHVVNLEKVTHITIEAGCTDQDMILIISDDGQGMSEAMTASINAGQFIRGAQDRIHVGIQNSCQRIRSLYKDKGSLSVESIPGEGTCFTIQIPRGNIRESANR